MAAWKQIFFALVILAGAAAAWVAFSPDARDRLAAWGVWTPGAPGEAQTEGARSGQPAAGGGQPRRRDGPPQTAVITQPVAIATINDRLTAIGTGRANSSVTVNPYSAGRLTDVLTRSGDSVKAGDIIATLDSEAEEIALDRAKIAVVDAQARVDRMMALRTSNTATAVQVTDAEMTLNNAELAVRDAELTLEHRLIRAPIAGIVGILPVETGNYVTTQTEIVTIDDRSKIKIDFWVPERYAGSIKVGGKLTAVPIARPDTVLDGTVSAIDNRVDEQSRTLRVQAQIDNSNDALRAGMSFEVSMHFPGDTYPSVNPLAIQWGSDGAYIWVIRDGKARRTPVRVIQRNTESVLVDADIAEGDLVVIEGVHAVREGLEPLIAGAEPRAANPARAIASGG